MASIRPHQFGCKKISLQYYSLFIERDIAHRGQVIEVKILFAGRFEFLLHAAEFLILHLQFELVNLQFVDHALHVSGRNVVQFPTPFLQHFFGSLAQV